MDYEMFPKELVEEAAGIIQIMQWIDCLHTWSDDAVKEFQNQVYGGNETEGYLKEKCETLKKLGVMYWLSRLDKRNFVRFMTIIINTGPDKWMAQNILGDKYGHKN